MLNLSILVRYLHQPVHAVVDVSDADAVIGLCHVVLRPDFFDQVPVSVIKAAFCGAVCVDRPDFPAVRVILVTDLPSVRHLFTEDVS